MDRNRIRWFFAAGLLGLLGFASCSPRLRPRKVQEAVPDTLVVIGADTLRRKPEMPPVRLMYGVPPTRFQVMELPDNGSVKVEEESK